MTKIMSEKNNCPVCDYKSAELLPIEILAFGVALGQSKIPSPIAAICCVAHRGEYTRSSLFAISKLSKAVIS